VSPGAVVSTRCSVSVIEAIVHGADEVQDVFEIATVAPTQLLLEINSIPEAQVTRVPVTLTLYPLQSWLMPPYSHRKLRFVSMAICETGWRSPS
jgi:hypothetical protein